MEYILLVAGHAVQGFVYRAQSYIGAMDKLTLLWVGLVVFAVFLIFGLGRKPGT